MSDLRKTINNFNKDNQEKGYKIKYRIWNKSDSNALCQVLVTHIPDKGTKDKFILLDPSLDIQDEISYFIDNIIASYHSTSYLKSNTVKKNFIWKNTKLYLIFFDYQ